jgi:flagellar biosynthesis protein FlhG
VNGPIRSSQAGLGPGLGAAAARAAASPDQAAGLRALIKQLEAKQLAAPRRERAHRAHPPVTHHPHPPTAAPVPAMTPAPAAARVITIASGKGGVGKTNLSVNLAAALAQRGRRVTLVDADLGVANADLLCGLTVARRVEHVLRTGQQALQTIALDAPGGFRLVPGSAGVARMADLSPAEREGLARHIVALERESDLVLVDAGAGVGALVRSLVQSAGTCLLVATPEPTAIADAYALIKCCQTGASAVMTAGTRWRLVVNQVRDEDEAHAVFGRVRLAAERFLGVEVSLAGWVPVDAQVPAAVRARMPLLLRSPESPAAGAIRQLAGRVLNDPDPIVTGAAGAGGERAATGLSGWIRRVLGGR